MECCSNFNEGCCCCKEPITNGFPYFDCLSESKPKSYLSGKFIVDGRFVYIKEVLYNNPATIVFWSDNTKTISKCHGSDSYSKEAGLAICIVKKLAGSTNVREIMQDWALTDSSRITLREIRHAKKAKLVEDAVVETNEPAQKSKASNPLKGAVDKLRTKKETSKTKRSKKSK